MKDLRSPKGSPVPLPGNANAAHKLGCDLMRRGQFTEVNDLACAAVQRFGNSIELKLLHLQSLVAANRMADAARTCAMYLRNHPRNGQLADWMRRLVRHIEKMDDGFINDLKEVPGVQGEALVIRALVAARNATEALVVYRQFMSKEGAPEVLPVDELVSLMRLARCHEAVEELAWAALEDDPHNVKRGQSLVEALLDQVDNVHPEKFGEAKEIAEALLENHPDHPEALFAMAQVWYTASRMDCCLPYFRQFFQIRPDHAARSGFVFNCNYDENLSRADLKREHVSWCERLQALVPKPPRSSANKRSENKRLRVGYISPDLGHHPVGFFAIPVLENHDDDICEVFIYSHRDPVAEHDALSQRLMASVGEDHWRWIEKASTRQVCEMIQSDGIDILVDLAGHSLKNRLDVFVHRAAPVQLSWLGYPHSTWLPNMDIRLSDGITEPEGDAEPWSSELIHRLPNGFHALEMPAGLPEPVDPPCLRNGYLTFGSFNNINKIGPRTIERWATLLRAIPDSRLILKHKTMQVMENREGLRSLFALEGVHPARITFKGITRERNRHFSAYHFIDIALDPVLYNGTTTTCEALYMGVPVLTLPGNRHASRVSASLLHRVGMDGWVARDPEHYVRIAQAAACNFEALRKRRARLRGDFLGSPLADTAGLARDLETAYTTIWRRYTSVGRKEDSLTTLKQS